MPAGSPETSSKSAPPASTAALDGVPSTNARPFSPRCENRAGKSTFTAVPRCSWISTLRVTDAMPSVGVTVTAPPAIDPEGLVAPCA